MSSTRLWIILLAVTSFLAGLAAGTLTGARIGPRAPERRPYDDYAAMLVRTYEVPADRERHLRAFLEQYHRDLEELKARHVAGAEPELIRLGETCRQRIRDYVLSGDARAAFDREARDLFTFPTPSGHAGPAGDVPRGG
jgi:hypothetical protein